MSASPDAITLDDDLAVPAETSAVQRHGAAVVRAHLAAIGAQHAVQERILRELENGDRPVLDEADLLEFATGSIAKVFGPRFAPVDALPWRARLPAPPFMFASRVTRLEGRTGEFGPAAITVEYDIPHDAWFAADGDVSIGLATEAGQSCVVLAAYLGVDLDRPAERYFRMLGGAAVFHGPRPRTGQTLRYETKIENVAGLGDDLIFGFRTDCFAGDLPVFSLSGARAGFFTRETLDAAGGIVSTPADRRRSAGMGPGWFKPLARTSRTRLDRAALEQLSEGNCAEVFGPAWRQVDGGVRLNPAIRLPRGRMLVLDEITAIDRLGGPRGLGRIEAVQLITPDDWFFACHFPGDPLVPGSLIVEGAAQVLSTYAMFLGLHLVFPDAEFQPVAGRPGTLTMRGEVTPSSAALRYVVEVTDVDLLPRPTVVADITCYDGERAVVRIQDFALQVRERPGAAYRPELGGRPARFLGRFNAAGEQALVNEFHMANICLGDLPTGMGPEFAVYDGRRSPRGANGDFKFVDRIMSLEGTRAAVADGSRMISEYDSSPESWYAHESGIADMPNCVLMETSLQAAALTTAYLGSILGDPDETYSIRNLNGTATVLRDIDLIGRTIRHESTLLSTQRLSGAILQELAYTLTTDGEEFYQGRSLFGYFSDAALANQSGLDGGRKVPPWLDGQPAARAERVDIAGDEDWRRPRPGDGLRLGTGHLTLIDEASLVPGGGSHGRGYLLARRRVDPADWYFARHFHMDPVMPGSLGVEAILQALQVFVMRSGLVDGFGPAKFVRPAGIPMTWKYRGQILREDPEMVFDVHITDIRRDDDGLVVVADANLWKRDLRIYEVGGVALAVRRDGAA